MYSITESKTKIKSIFRKGKSNITAGDEKCKTCGGKCCSKQHPYLTLYEYDFEPNKMENGLKYLMKQNVLMMRLYNANEDGTGGYFVIHMLLKDGCHFLEGNECALKPHERPIVCCMFGPRRYRKDGKERKHITCKGIIDEWLQNVIDEEYNGRFFEFEHWHIDRNMLHSIFNKLPDNRKIELFRNLDGTRIIKGYDSANVFFKEIKRK